MVAISEEKRATPEPSSEATALQHWGQISESSLQTKREKKEMGSYANDKFNVGTKSKSLSNLFGFIGYGTV